MEVYVLAEVSAYNVPNTADAKVDIYCLLPSYYCVMLTRYYNNNLKLLGTTHVTAPPRVVFLIAEGRDSPDVKLLSA